VRNPREASLSTCPRMKCEYLIFYYPITLVVLLEELRLFCHVGYEAVVLNVFGWVRTESVFHPLFTLKTENFKECHTVLK
jgi:hypothetical protein